MDIEKSRMTGEVIRGIRKPMSGSNNKGVYGWNEVGEAIANAATDKANKWWLNLYEERADYECEDENGSPAISIWFTPEEYKSLKELLELKK